MREIKFRGKRKSSKKIYQKWVFGSLWVQKNGTTEIMYENEEKNMDIENIEVIPETVGEYTGLKDKNGVEIYESDLVKEGKSEGRVIFNEDGFEIEWYKNPEGWSETLKYHHENLKVVGNEFEGEKS